MNVLIELDEQLEVSARHAAERAGLNFSAWVQNLIRSGLEGNSPRTYEEARQHALEVLRGELPPGEGQFDRNALNQRYPNL